MTPGFIRIICSVILLAAFTLPAESQNLITARPGPNGIFLFMGKKIPSGKITRSYRIEKRIEEGEWSFLTEVRTPSSTDIFIANVDKAKQLFPAQPLPSREKLKLIHEKAITLGNTDSLSGMILHYPVRLALGLIYHDAAARNGKAFQYRVTEIDDKGISLPPVITDTITMPYHASYSEVALAETSRTDQSVMIKWMAAGNNASPLFMVHRMENDKPQLAGGLTGRYTVNDTTYFTFRDTLKPSQAGTELRYFLTPYDLLGNAGKSSKVVVITSDEFDKASFDTLYISKSGDPFGNLLSWTFNHPGTAKNMEVYRSESKEIGYIKVATLSNIDTQFLDEKIKPEKSYYYYVQATSRNGVRSKPSSKIMEQPFSPRRLNPPVLEEATGINGGVRLTISSIDGLAAGIRVFRNSGGNSGMVAITDLIRKSGPTLLFIDSSENLSGWNNYSYAVRCEKPGYGISDLSGIIQAKPLKNSTPPPPSFIKAVIGKNNISLFWEDITTTVSDIAGYIVSRRVEYYPEDHHLPFIALTGNVKPHPLNMFGDESVNNGDIYTYSVQSIGFPDNRISEEIFLTVSCRVNNPIPPLQVSLNAMQDGLKLKWIPVTYQGLQSYNIYRQTGEGNPELLINLPSAASDYMDESCPEDAMCSYFITTVDDQGKESERSVVVK